MMQDHKTKQTADIFLAEVRRCRNEARNYRKRQDHFMAKKVNVAPEGEGITFYPGFHHRFPRMLIKSFKFFRGEPNCRFFIFWASDLEV